jgi:tRNA(Ile)-lysidine synthase TilS/MesJ
LAESFLMNFFHNGGLRTMKANYTVKWVAAVQSCNFVTIHKQIFY